MNALESTLEAPAFNYVSFGIFTVVNNLWTWVAVITAAISFWRIRTTSYSVKPKQQHRTDRNTSGSHPVHDVSLTDVSIEPPASSPSPSLSPSPPPAAATAKAMPSVGDVQDVDWVLKGSKFTLYYYSEKRESEGELTAVKEWRDDNDNGCGDWWERVMRVRMGDMGWYRNQDLTLVNGNVVRLWNECRRRERCYGSCCGVW